MMTVSVILIKFVEFSDCDAFDIRLNADKVALSYLQPVFTVQTTIRQFLYHLLDLMDVIIQDPN